VHSLNGLNLPSEVAKSVANWSNLAITKRTWSTYKTAEIMLGKCSLETKISMALSLTESQILTFVDRLARVRGLKCATINSYLAGIRQLHIITGLAAPVLRSDLVKLVLKGISNVDGIAKRKKDWQGRLPMTINSMLLFKTLIKNSHYLECDKALLWAVSTLAFAEAFRIHEILAKAKSTFDPNFTFLTKDLTLTSKAGQEILHVRLKCPKESKTAAPTIVDVYQNSGKICPVRAVKKWLSLKHRQRGLPLFRFDNGTPLTGSKLNRIMKSLFSPHVDPEIGFFGTHSFRIGIASMLRQAGFEDQEIMDTGRWSSRVFERYLKLSRTRRAVMQKRISRLPALRK
jgi:hypothetical protein